MSDRELLLDLYRWNFAWQEDYAKNKVFDLPYDVAYDYALCLCNFYYSDIKLEDLYKKYLNYIFNFYKYRKNKKYMSLKLFEYKLNNMGLKSYVSYDENYKPIKYVCFDYKNYLKK